MMTMINKDASPIYSIVKSIFGEPKKYNEYNGQLSYECPVCADGKDNLEINTNLLVMKCWKCHEQPEGLRGTLRSLVKKYGSNHQLELYDMLTEDFSIGKVEKRVVTDVVLPKEFVLIESLNKKSPDYNNVIHYLTERGLTYEEIIKNKIGVCLYGKYANRIIIPSYDGNGKLNYFTGRTYIGAIPKYKNPFIPKEDFIINESEINWDSTIYLVEGAFDRLGIGIKNTIPLLGKVLFDKLLEKIARNAKGYIVIALDPDATKNAYQIYKKLESFYFLKDRIRVIDLPNDLDWSEIKSKYGKKGIYKCLKRVRKLTLQDEIKYNL